MNDVYLSLGGNSGQREDFLYKAFWRLSHELQAIGLRVSSIYETEAWGQKDLSPFLNQVLYLQTSRQASEILECVLKIEQELGRIRTAKKVGYENRTIDIDILFYNQAIIESEELKVPHPLIQDRKFILIPMCELNPQWIHPVKRKTMQELLNACEDQCEVKMVLAAEEYLRRP